jgi:hypothetical protein
MEDWNSEDWNIGRVEYWNIGVKRSDEYFIFPIFHHSNITLFHCFWER